MYSLTFTYLAVAPVQQHVATQKTEQIHTLLAVIARAPNTYTSW